MFIQIHNDSTNSLADCDNGGSDGGASFGPTVNLSNNVGESTRPEVTMVGNSVYVVWEDNTDGNDEILYRRSINAGSSFESAINLSHSPDASTNPDIAASGNNVYVVWDGIFFTRSTNGGVSFSDPVDITISGGIIPAIAASGDHVYVTWRGSFFKRSIDGGASFGPTVPMGINCQSSPDKCPVIAASGENVYLLLVKSNGGSGCTPALCGADVLYRRSTDGGASFGGFILTSGFSYSPAVSATGNSVYIVWTDSIQPLDSGGPDIEYRKSTDGGASFGPTENLSNNAGSSTEPAISAASSSSLQ